MPLPYYDTLQGDCLRATPLILQKAAAFDHFGRTFAKLDSQNLTKNNVHEAYPTHHELPCEKHPLALTNNCTPYNAHDTFELSTNSSPSSPTTNRSIIDNSYAVHPHLSPETGDHAENLALLTRRVALAIDTATHALDTLKAEVEDIQHRGGPSKGQNQGGTWNRKSTPNTNPNNTNTITNDTKDTQPPDLPPFMATYLPRPSPTPSPPLGPPGTRRCTIGRPLGKILRPSDGRFYNLGKCDKHADEGVFEESMRIHEARMGEYGVVEGAWKCSGSAVLGPVKGKGVRHR